jgi:hypothetical protein
MKTLRPVNQKSIYHSFAEVYERLMNDDITIDKAEQASHALDGMNRTYALELKRAEVEKELSRKEEPINVRVLESKNFETE